jgi:hypothetical protein
VRQSRGYAGWRTRNVPPCRNGVGRLAGEERREVALDRRRHHGKRLPRHLEPCLFRLRSNALVDQAIPREAVRVRCTYSSVSWR